MALFVGGGLWVREPEDWPPVLVAMAVIFVSILAHELGHAAAGRRFGAKPAILLHSMGGLCYLPGGRFNRRQNILVSLAGPAAGFLLAGITFVLLSGLAPEQPLVRYGFVFSLYINVIWTILNLLPILPLDGGQVLRDILGPSRIQTTRWIGAGAAGLIAVAALSAGFLFGAVIAGILAFLNFQGRTIEGGVVREAPAATPPGGR